MKRVLMLGLLLPASAFAIPGKDFNECVQQADQRFAESRQFCFDNAQGAERQACLMSAERHLHDREDNCKAVEMVHESLNPNVKVNVGFGGPRTVEQKPEIKPIWEQQQSGGAYHQPGAPMGTQQPGQTTFMNFDDFMKTVLKK